MKKNPRIQLRVDISVFQHIFFCFLDNLGGSCFVAFAAFVACVAFVASACYVQVCHALP